MFFLLEAHWFTSFFVFSVFGVVLSFLGTFAPNVGTVFVSLLVPAVLGGYVFSSRG